MTVKGIDVSAFQASDYQTSGFDFVFVKATQGTSYVNPKLGAQTARGRVAGLVVGFYHFLTAGNVDAQAKYFVAKAPSQAGDILVCDWETDPATGRHPTSAEKDQFLRAVKTLRPDHKVLLYCNTSFWKSIDTSSYAGDGLWIADPNHTAGSPGVKASWLFHQYSDSGGLDRNLGNFTDKTALRAWAAGSTPQEDPLAGFTAQQIHDAVWKIDDIAAPADAPDIKTNPTWQPQSLLKDTNARVRVMQAQEVAQTAAITKLAELVGSGVDTATVVAAVQKAIAEAVVKVSVDVTGPNAT